MLDKRVSEVEKLSTADQTEDHVTPGLSAMHNNMLFDTSPSPVLDLKQEYTPLSKRPPASHCPSPLRLGKGSVKS